MDTRATPVPLSGSTGFFGIDSRMPHRTWFAQKFIASPIAWLSRLRTPGAAQEGVSRPSGTDAAPGGNGRRRLFPPLIVFLLATCGIVVGGTLVFRQFQMRVERDAQAQLQSIARLKLQQLHGWLVERQNDVEVSATRNPFLAEFVARWERSGWPNDMLARLLLRQLTGIASSEEYSRVSLLDTAGVPRLSTGAIEIDPVRLELARRAVSEGRAVFSDFRWEEHTGFALDLAAPLLRSPGEATGVLLLEINPHRYLYPLLQSWPVPSATAETILVRQEGNVAVSLNALRHRSDPTFHLRMPLDDARSPASAAVRGQLGVFSGIDYRGEPVLAYLERFPNSPWFMIAKIDRREILAPVREVAVAVVVIASLLMLTSAAATGMWWWGERSRYELQRRALEQRFEFLTRHVNDAILLTDGDGRVLDANDSAARIYGYRPGQLLGLTLDQLSAEVLPPQADTGAIFESLHRKSWGTAFPVEVSARTVRIGERAYRLAVVRDITERKEAEAALRSREQLFHAVFDQAAVGIALIAPTGRFIRVNRRLCGILGYDEEELLLSGVDHVVHPEDVAVGREAEDRLRAGEIATYAVEKRYVRKDGRVVWGLVTSSCLRDPTGAPKYNITVIEDITDRKLAEHRLRETQAQLRLAVDIAQIGFWTRDLDDETVYLSPELKKQLGYREDDLADSFDAWVSLLHAEDRERVMEALGQFLRAPERELETEFRMRHRNGGYRWISARLVPVFENGRLTRVMGTQLDITVRKEAEERTRQVAQHDSLTGLPNRALLHEFTEHLLASARRGEGKAAVLFVDLDRFKPINDTYGHEVGDEVLKEVARRLTECVREEDLVGRLGGDEFLAVLSHIRNERDAGGAARHVLEALSQPYRIGCLQLEVTPSIGISLFPQDGADVVTLIRSADAAMYHAKQSGRAHFQFYTEEMNQRASESFRIEALLRRALEQGEFHLLYQPVLDTRTGRLAAAEALLRWRPDGGTALGPERFIPMAEANGLIGDLGEWVLREVCAQQRAWHDLGLPDIPLAINVSVKQLLHRDFASRLEAVLDQFGVAPGLLQLEFGEDALMKNLDEAVLVLQRLHALGLGLVLDDFGRGHGGLSDVGRLPIDQLKVDLLFVSRLGQDQASRAASEAIIALGKSLGLKVSAEGIESEETYDFFRSRGCDLGQGFHISPPLPAQEFERWHRERQAA